MNIIFFFKEISIKFYQILIIVLVLISCNDNPQKKFDKDLADKLEQMVALDQLVASNAFPPKSYSHLTQHQWEQFKDSIYKLNERQLQEIFKSKGFVGYDLAGKKGAENFWLLVQHSDHEPEFQKEVLKKMKLAIDKNNANPNSYAFLVDRVNINTGKQQIYGTQVEYNTKIAQAYPLNLADSINVNKRRREIELEPLEVYLNEMTKIHFEMNKQQYKEMGVLKPELYIIE
ncbi:DUF6624 domain-containing protein [Mesoflavibacter sp. CH_XMU1404-2]|uniref:DUF6624 domain-containing protein n=1 Tax=Mesoflavibacter sp. CH_XMU1404-2 TaxID=3107766 RepID=UPI00300B37EA